jgi:hypothetical protein
MTQRCEFMAKTNMDGYCWLCSCVPCPPVDLQQQNPPKIPNIRPKLTLIQGMY